MEIYTTRQKHVDGKVVGWHMVCSNSDGSRVYPVGYCAEHEPHVTAEEAAECYRTWTLDNAKFGIRSETAQKKCAICGEWTQMRAELREPFHHRVTLCANHQTRDDLAVATAKAS